MPSRAGRPQEGCGIGLVLLLFHSIPTFYDKRCLHFLQLYSFTLRILTKLLENSYNI
jgi:hypothetical protein